MPNAKALEQHWGKVIDHDSCIGCHACSTACKSENQVPLSVNRTYVKYVDVGKFPDARRAFQVTRCNQCQEPPCTYVCPTTAMHQRPDGIVDFDKSICIGCKACMAACPYDAIFINPDDHAAEKCNFCAHRLDVGLEPACVVVCPEEAIHVGNLDDPASLVAQEVGREVMHVRRPQKKTRPKLFYKGAHQATLDPLAAENPGGGIFMWSEQPGMEGAIASGHPELGNSAAHAILSYDVPHRIPWGWKVSAYTLTKGIAAGAYLVPALLMLLGVLAPGAQLFAWVGPIIAMIFLTITGVLLIWDLKKPQLFWMIFTKHHWRSWLVKGSFIIMGFSGVLTVHLAAMILGRPDFAKALAWIGIPLAAGTAVYTAFLFAQCTARDIWQSPALLPQLLIQACLSGSAVLGIWSAYTQGGRYAEDTWLAIGIFSAMHMIFVIGEVFIAHPTEHATLAAHQMTSGRYKHWFRIGFVLMLAACFAPWIGVVSIPCALIGLQLFEHAYVQSAQSISLA